VPSLPDAETAARLVNADLLGADALRGLLAGREGPGRTVDEGDVARLRAFLTELRRVFDAAAAGDGTVVVDRLNRLVSDRRVTPQVVACHDPDGQPAWRLRAQASADSLVDRLAAESLLGLATLVCELGPGRLGVCSAPGCGGVFVDVSPNRSRRYCSERCSSRTNVAAYRARQRLVHQARTAG
jgi:predicted RNA-binding Zn ribbon-like protein